ncbi:hypothetical protein G9A89_008476 [Geosiphon pyriformis]|nr:hypothetical protein G9A89_008476 [Geosiphon pyriformis]
MFSIFPAQESVPILENSQPEYVQFFKAPDVEMCGYGTDIEIAQCDFTWQNLTVVTFDSCARPDGTPWLTAGPKKDDYNFCYWFSGGDNLFYGDKDQQGDYLRSLGFYFQFKNITGYNSLSITVPTIAIKLLDPDFNPLWNKTKTNAQEWNANAGFILRNDFDAIFNQSTFVKMVFTKFQGIKPDDFSSLLGLKPNYINKKLISAVAHDHPLRQSDKFGPDRKYSGYFQLEVDDFKFEVLTQKRLKTILGSFGVAGGAFSIIFTLYSFLYGDQKLKPWGLMHRIVKLRVRDSAQMRNVPLISPFNEIASQELTQEEQMALVKDRIKELEGILSNYCFDTTPLERLSHRVKYMQQPPVFDERVDLEGNIIAADNFLKDAQANEERYFSEGLNEFKKAIEKLRSWIVVLCP